jgi:hypothetical protein
MLRPCLSAVFALTLTGCGSPRVNLPPAPPHGGTAFALPEGKGFVEVVRQEAPGLAGQSGQTQLVVYFLDTECKPLSTGAIAAYFRPRGSIVAPISLAPIATPDSPDTRGLASPPFRDPGEIVGVLSATIESKTVSVDINVR